MENIRKVKVGDVFEWMEGDRTQWMQNEDSQECIKAGVLAKKGKLRDKNCWTFSDAEQWKFLYNINDLLTISECNPQVGDVLELVSHEREYIVSRVRGNRVYFNDNSCSSALTSTAKKWLVKSRAAAKKWEPQEGEIVWIKRGEGAKVKVIVDLEGYKWLLGQSSKDVIYNIPLLPSYLDSLEPYTDQDCQKIDFGKAGQWIKCRRCFARTGGEMSETGGLLSFSVTTLSGIESWTQQSDDWELCTPEQIELIEKLQKTLK